LQQDIHQKAVSRLLLTKFSLSWAVIPTIVTAGMARVAWSRLLPADLLAEVIWTGSLVLAGYYLGNSLTNLELGLKILATTGGVASVITLIGPVGKFITSIIFKNNQILSGDNL
jgi:membrane protein DedA with SNARE-associated domain